MTEKDRIEVYDTRRFTERFMQPGSSATMLQPDYGRFFLVRVEEMYSQIRQDVPASRSLGHSMLFLTEGAAVMKIGSETYQVGAGEVLFVPAGQVFSFRTDDVNQGFLCHFHDDFLIGKIHRTDQHDFGFLKVWGNPLVRPDEAAGQAVRTVLNRLLGIYKTQGLKNTGLIHAYLLTVLYEILPFYEKPLAAATGISMTITHRFRELLAAHIGQMQLVSEYAALLNVSPNHLNKVIRRTTGKSPSQWIEEAIVLEAKVFLTQSNLTISEITAAVGLEDPSYFARMFRKRENMTPSEFRARIEKSGKQPDPS